MPTGTHLLDTGYPVFTGGESTETKLRSIENYLFMLLEELRWLMHHLGEGNFDEDALLQLDARIRDKAAEVLQADTVIADTVIAGELYADYGAIADLTVWRLRTDYLRARNWLQGSTAQLDYIYIHDEQIDFISAVTDGSRTEQFTRDGLRYYWTDETRTQMTCLRETAWPVYVYHYDELTKLSIRFQPVALSGGGTTVMPVLTLGAGDQNGNARGYIYKDQTELRIRYVATGGTVHELVLGDGGAAVDGVSIALDGGIPRVGGLGIQVVTAYPAVQAPDVLYIKTES